jgi:predicted nucleotidyltransferase
MNSGTGTAPSAQVRAVLEALQQVFGADALLGVYLHGSSVQGGLRPDSDLDLFGVTARSLTAAERPRLVEAVVPLSWRRQRPDGWRPVELTLVAQSDVRPWRYPPVRDFQYGEWLREELVSGALDAAPAPDPDLAVLLTMVRAAGQPLLGPPAAELLDPVPRDDLLRAMLDEIPFLLDDLPTDTRNVLLTLARIWATVATGEILSKDAAAAWAASRLPDELRPVMEEARRLYLRGGDDLWKTSPESATACGQHVAGKIRPAATSSTDR